jgi:hypothetical protein
MPRTVGLLLQLAGLGALCGALLTAVEPPARAEDFAPARQEKSDAELTGRDIYQRVLDNRFRSYIQKSVMVSGDRAGNHQETVLRMWFQSYREESGEAQVDTLSKTMVKYLEPFDLRHTGYLIIQHPDRGSDQFVYLPTNRRVRRVNLRGEAVFGTDFSFEDVIPREIEHADYERRADTILHDIPCFVVEAVPKPENDSEYSRFLVYVDKQRNVPLRTRYWDEQEVEIKELDAAPESIQRVGGIWVPTRATMRHLRLETYTELRVDELEPNPTLKRSTFELRRLEAH